MPPTPSRARLTALGNRGAREFGPRESDPDEFGPRESDPESRTQGVVWLVERDARVRAGMPALTVGVMRCARAGCPHRGGVPGGRTSGAPEAVVVGRVGAPGGPRLATALIGGGRADGG